MQPPRGSVSRSTAAPATWPPAGRTSRPGSSSAGPGPFPPGTWPYSFAVRSGGTTCTFTGAVPATVVVVGAPARRSPRPRRRRNPRPSPPRSRPRKPRRNRRPKPTPRPTRKPVKATPKPTAKPASTDTPRSTDPASTGPATASPGLPSEPGTTPIPTPTRVGDAAATCRRCDRHRIRWRRLRWAERRRERPHRRLHQPVGRLAHDDGRRCRGSSCSSCGGRTAMTIRGRAGSCSRLRRKALCPLGLPPSRRARRPTARQRRSGRLRLRGHPRCSPLRRRPAPSE